MLKLRRQVTKRDVLGFRLPMLTHEEPQVAKKPFFFLGQWGGIVDHTVLNILQ